MRQGRHEHRESDVWRTAKVCDLARARAFFTGCMATRYDLDDITRRAEEAHQQRLAALRETVTAADAVADAEAQLQQLRDELNTAVALAVDAGWNEAELATFGLPTSAAKPAKRRTTGSGTRRRNSGRTAAAPTSISPDSGANHADSDEGAAA